MKKTLRDKNNWRDLERLVGAPVWQTNRCRWKANILQDFRFDSRERNDVNIVQVWGLELLTAKLLFLNMS